MKKKSSWEKHYLWFFEQEICLSAFFWLFWPELLKLDMEATLPASSRIRPHDIQSQFNPTKENNGPTQGHCECNFVSDCSSPH